MRDRIFILLCSFTWLWTYAQDTMQIEEVVISATKTERSLSKIPLPVSSISGKQIQAIGSNRLQEVLSEQTGLIIVPQINGIGNGVQIQGLNPDYTLILIDGEPIIGRYAGTLELNRISTGDIKKIEIVKGPSSSLYGSDALAGVINIITKQSLTTQLEASIKYAERNTLNTNLSASFAQKNTVNQIFVNRFSTNGYDYQKNIYGQTVSPYVNYTIRAKTSVSINSHQELQCSAKYFIESQDNKYQVINGRDSIKVYGNGGIKDWSIYPSYTYKWSNRTQFVLRMYASNYVTSTNLKELSSNHDFYADDFSQQFIRPELQSSCYYSKKQNWTFGLGSVYESVRTNRYGSGDSRRQNTYYSFLQHEYIPNQKWNLLSGIRYDRNSVYRNKFSPKIALHFSPSKSWSSRASFGTGFKSPDFRQLYLNFNNAAAGYSVFGTENLKTEIAALQLKNLIQEIYIPLDAKNLLRPESSQAWNLGLTYQWKGHQTALSLFRNDLVDLIAIQTVALTNTGNFIYSYSNINRAFTQGFDLNYTAPSFRNFTLNLAYQYLESKDKDIIKAIHDKTIFGRDPVTLITYLIKKKDYIGLPYHSRHTGSIKLSYSIPRWRSDIQFRYIYRGSFGINGTNGSVNGTLISSSDSNANNILDRYDNLIAGYGLCHLTINTQLNEHWKLQCGAENIFNYTDPILQPTLIGRTAFVQVNYKWLKKIK